MHLLAKKTHTRLSSASCLMSVDLVISYPTIYLPLGPSSLLTGFDCYIPTYGFLETMLTFSGKLTLLSYN
ncbi:actin-related protein 2 [Gossypium australe]|uniref:Actin-related protein 2 n=1 Tax=Gossypium australe TaxID=47621 RepID=A0A5B6UQ05_9ROSI|nr:actin-related protein 2 [Gossypium australe]